MNYWRWAIHMRDSGGFWSGYWGDQTSNPRLFTARATARMYRQTIDPAKEKTKIVRVTVDVHEIETWL